jgi:hypothetical protein
MHCGNILGERDPETPCDHCIEKGGEHE